MENFCEYYYLNIIASINSFSALNITVNTTLKYYHNQALNKNINLMGGAMKEIWGYGPLGYETVFEKLVNL